MLHIRPLDAASRATRVKVPLPPHAPLIIHLEMRDESLV